MAIETKTIQIRMGLKADLLTAELLPGEQILATDTGEVGIKSAGGGVIWYATLDANGKVKQNPASVGQAGGIMALPATLPGTGKILKMGTGGAPAEADDGTDYGLRQTVLWEGWMQSNGTVALSQSILNFRKIVVALSINNFFQGTWNNEYYVPRPEVMGVAQIANVNVWGVLGYMIFVFEVDRAHITITDASKLAGAGFCRVIGIK